jgi:hypothetical protein
MKIQQNTTSSGKKLIITNKNGYNVLAGWADLDSHKLL